MDIKELKSRFIKVYSNLPLGIRKEIIILLDDKPISWDVAYSEIKNNTKKAKEILKKLKQLGAI